jgi:hypothetical protein
MCTFIQEDRPLSETSQPPADGGGGGAHEISEEPHARDQLAHSPLLGAVLSPMRGMDAERQTVPGSGDVERPLQDARRKQHRT